MDSKRLRELLNEVSCGKVSPEEAERALRTLPFEELEFANIDNHRGIRTGYPEVVFCEGKTDEQVGQIMAHLAAVNGIVLGTRASVSQYETVKAVVKAAEIETAETVYADAARIIAVRNSEFSLPETGPGTIAVVTAGTADIPVAEEAAVTCEAFGNSVDRIYDVGVAGIHRLFAKLDRIRAANVVIVIAGMEGALASVVGGLIDKPVIAVPTSIGYGANLGGVAALLSMLNSCANGVGVVNIDNGFGAGYLASTINKINTGK